MSTLYREDMVERVSEACNQPKKMVRQIITDYTHYIYNETAEGRTVKFLHIFYIENKEKPEHETLAYVSTEIADGRGYSGDMVLNILEVYESCLIDELLKGRGISIYGVAKVYTVPNLRIRKTGRLANKGYRVRATKSLRSTVNNHDR